MKLQEIYDLIVESGVGQFSGAGIIFFDGKKVLLLKKPGGRWAFPGGKPIMGETPENTAERETKEEVGKVVGENIGEIRIELDDRLFYSFVYKVNEPFRVDLSKEHTDYKWVDYSELPKLKLQRNVFKALKKITKKLNSLQVEII